MKSLKRELLEWVVTIGVAAAFAFIINFFGGLAVVEGPSMMQTLQDKDILIRATYLRSAPQFGDIIAFKTDMPHPWKLYRMLGVKKALVKRVIGLPGDHVVVKDGNVYVNEILLHEDYIKDGTTNGEADAVVPEGHLFVMGDNRLDSNDSRGTVGFVDIDSVIGRIAYRIYPFKSMGRPQ
jgi:signal peptidase I